MEELVLQEQDSEHLWQLVRRDPDVDSSEGYCVFSTCPGRGTQAERCKHSLQVSKLNTLEYFLVHLLSKCDSGLFLSGCSLPLSYSIILDFLTDFLSLRLPIFIVVFFQTGTTDSFVHVLFLLYLAPSPPPSSKHSQVLGL